MAQRRQKGIFGLPAKYKDVRETNNRGSFHVHGSHHGGCTLALLAEIAENETLRRREHAMFMLGLDTQLCAELPLESDGASELRASLASSASFVLVPYSCTRTVLFRYSKFSPTDSDSVALAALPVLGN